MYKHNSTLTKDQSRLGKRAKRWEIPRILSRPKVLVLHHGDNLDNLPKWGRRGTDERPQRRKGDQDSRRSGGELVGGEALTPLSLILGSDAVPIKLVSCGRWNQRVGSVHLPLFNCNGLSRGRG
jgi:hypothetical protein